MRLRTTKRLTPRERQLATKAFSATRTGEERYVRALRGIIRAFTKALVEAIEREQAANHRFDSVGSGARRDAWWDEIIDTETLRLMKQIGNFVGPAFDQMARVAETKGAGAVKELLRVNPNSAILRSKVDAFREQNIRLVEDAGRAYAASVRKIFSDPENQGRSWVEIKRDLITRGGVSESRAELIARDQTLKLNAQITQSRQQAAGVTRYRWSTSKDERVRADHRALEGTIQEWSDPPIIDKKSGRREHPGQDFQCRCVAVPVVDELVGLGYGSLPEPVKVEPTKVEPPKPVKVKPIKVEVPKPEPIKVEPAKPVKVEPIKVEPVKVEPIVQPIKVEPPKPPKPPKPVKEPPRPPDPIPSGWMQWTDERYPSAEAAEADAAKYLLPQGKSYRVLYAGKNKWLVVVEDPRQMQEAHEERAFHEALRHPPARPGELPSVGDYARASEAIRDDGIDGHALRGGAIQNIVRHLGLRPENEVRIFTGEKPGGIVADGVHHWDGRIEITPQRAQEAKRALRALSIGQVPDTRDAKGLHTLIHEEIHGTGNLTGYQYQKPGGSLVEESVTEILARKSMHTLTGNDVYRKNITGNFQIMSYADHIDTVYTTVQNALRAGGSSAAFGFDELVETAKRFKQNTQRDALRDNLVVDFAAKAVDTLGLQGKQREDVRNRIIDGLLGRK